MSCDLRYYLGNDNTFYARNVKKTSDNSPLLSGVGSVTLYDKRSGAIITGQVWPATLIWDAAQKAFVATLSSTLVVTKRQFLRAVVTINGGGGFVFYDDPELQVGTPSDP